MLSAGRTPPEHVAFGPVHLAPLDCRSELAKLDLHNLNRERQTIQIRQGKGPKDRVIPVGTRALAWLERYLDEVRPRLARTSHQRALFLTSYGEPFNPDVISRIVSKFIKKAETGRPGSVSVVPSALR